MKGLRNIFLKNKFSGQEVYYLFGVKLKGPWFKGVASRIDLIITGTRITSKNLESKDHPENYLKFKFLAKNTKLKNRHLILLKLGDSSFECYDLFNDSYTATSTYTERGSSNTRTYSEQVRYSDLYFKVPAIVFSDYLDKENPTVILQFPKMEYSYRIKRYVKDYYMYVAKVCDDGPYPTALHKKIARAEKVQKASYYSYMIGGLIAPIVAIVLIVFLGEDDREWRSERELILMILSGWLVFYTLLHWLFIRRFVGSRVSFY